MAGTQPGESRGPTEEGSGRRLATPPSARYAEAVDDTGRAHGGDSVAGPVSRALLVAIGGGAALFLVGAILASTAGLLFVAGVTGAGIGLVLARARVPADDAPAALTQRAVTRLAIGLALVAVVGAALVTWLYARAEGGTLGPIDYVLETFGPFVPGEALIAALAAAWGARAGPVSR